MAMPDVNNPISTYEDLKEAVQLWIDRDDEEFVGQVPNFINFAEKEIYREMRFPPMEKEAYLKIVNGQADIPTDWLESIYMTTCTGWNKVRETSSDEVLYNLNLYPNSTSKAVNEIMFCRMGKRFFFYPAIDANLPVTDKLGNQHFDGSEMILGYYADPVELVGDSESSTLLQIAPDLLLYTALKHACSFVQDNDGEQAFTAKADAAMQQMQDQKQQQDFKGSPKVVAIANINTYW